MESLSLLSISLSPSVNLVTLLHTLGLPTFLHLALPEPADVHVGTHTSQFTKMPLTISDFCNNVNLSAFLFLFPSHLSSGKLDF